MAHQDSCSIDSDLGCLIGEEIFSGFNQGQLYNALLKFWRLSRSKTARSAVFFWDFLIKVLLVDVKIVRIVEYS